MEGRMKDYIVTVMARDRVGIVRDVSTALDGLGGNISHVSQTVMRGYFTLIVSVHMPDDRTQLEIRQAVERTGDVGEFEVNVRPFEEAAAQTPSQCERFTLTIQGNDRPGIIARVTNYLADEGINIDDFYAYIKDSRFVMLAQVLIPAEMDTESVQTSLEQMGEEYQTIVHLQHENIFKATSEISPVLDLQR
jgi:glycine cleavage system transcriptional repressor